MDKKKVLKWIYIAVPVLIIVIAAGFLSGPVYGGYFSGKTMRGLKIGNIEAGGKTQDELTKTLTKITEKTEKAKIMWNGNEIELNLSESGILPDVEKTVENAMKAGKENFRSIVASWYGGNETDFVFEASKEQFNSNIKAMLTELGFSEGSYSVTVEANKAVFTINENAGEPDTDTLLQEIEAQYPDFTETLELKQKEFIWPEAEQIRADFDSEASDAYVDNSGGERKIIGHKEGRKLDFDALKKAIDSKEKTFSVSYEILKPKVYTDQLGDENFPVLLGKCVTKYNEGAVSRSSNVKLAASKINGYVMNKGDVFSFNAVVGKRNYAAGFKDAPVYTGSGVENGVGGGVCQVSSTLYGAVLRANLNIVSRTNHSYTVSYTEPGLDATVSYGSIDFKFSNPFPQPVKIKATASGGTMTVYIYGTKQNDNTVSLEHKILSTTPRSVRKVLNPALKVGSEVIKTAGYDGMKVQNYRHIKDSSGNIIKTENLGVSTYVTLDKVIEYNDGARENPDSPTESQGSENKVYAPAFQPEPPSSQNNEVPVTPTQPNLQQDPEYSGNADPNAPLNEMPGNENPLGELENILGE